MVNPPTDANPTRPANHYVDKAELSACLVEYRRTGVICERLGLMLMAIAKGVNEKYQFSPDRDDFASDCWLHLTTQAPLRRVDPAKNPFGFFTKCAERFGQRRRGRWYKQLRQAAEYRQHKAAALAEVLTAEDLGDYLPDDAIADQPHPDLKAGALFLRDQADDDQADD